MMAAGTKKSSDSVNETAVIQLPVAEQARINRERADTYHRYQIDAAETTDLAKYPRRFNVKVGKFGLAKLIFKEFFKYFGHWDVIFSRPCTYGVFSGPIGGFAPRPDLCVGCLRCEVQHPEFVKVTHNPAMAALGDAYMTAKHIATIDEEARKGTVPVRGQGYRGRFGGPGFDQMFTDMSEIVRPSRDGIHGRELIGTSVDLGSKPMRLKFDAAGGLLNAPKMMSIQVPFFYEVPVDAVATGIVPKILAEAASTVDTLFFLPDSTVDSQGLAGPHVVPIIPAGRIGSIDSHGNGTRMVEMAEWNAASWDLVSDHPLLVSVRLPFAGDWLSTMKEMIAAGVSIIHLVADHHGEADDGQFIMDLFREAHFALIDMGCRDEVTLLGTGGIAGADHLPKAIITGMDAVGLDLPLLVAMQARLSGDTKTRGVAAVALPADLDVEWGLQRILNLSCSWRDQLLEILGAMGVREVRRLRGETGRAMWCGTLEDEAFGDIEGYVGGGQ
jgi:hypothetical protein